MGKTYQIIKIHILVTQTTTYLCVLYNYRKHAVFCFSIWGKELKSQTLAANTDSIHSDETLLFLQHPLISADPLIVLATLHYIIRFQKWSTCNEIKLPFTILGIRLQLLFFITWLHIVHTVAINYSYFIDSP